MPRENDELYGVFLRHNDHLVDNPESCEEPIVTCHSYGEARRIKSLLFKNAPECIIRFLGDTGGGD